MAKRRYRPAGKRYKPGDYFVMCQRSGFKTLRSKCRFTWDNLLVREDMWEPRQPQDYVRGRVEDIAAEDARSGWGDDFLTTNEVTEDSL